MLRKLTVSFVLALILTFIVLHGGISNSKNLIISLVIIGYFIFSGIYTTEDLYSLRIFLLFFYSLLFTTIISSHAYYRLTFFLLLLVNLSLKAILYTQYRSPFFPKLFIKTFNLVVFADIISFFYLLTLYHFYHISLWYFLFYCLAHSAIYNYFFYHLFSLRWKRHLESFKFIYYIYIYLTGYIFLSFIFPFKYVVIIAFLVSVYPFFSEKDWKYNTIVFGVVNCLIFFAYFYFTNNIPFLLLLFFFLTVIFLKRFLNSLSKLYLFFSLASFFIMSLLFFNIADFLSYTTMSYLFILLAIFIFTIKYFLLNFSYLYEREKYELNDKIKIVIQKLNFLLKMLINIILIYAFIFGDYPLYVAIIVGVSFMLFVDKFFIVPLPTAWWFMFFPHLLIFKVVVDFSYHKSFIFYFPFFVFSLFMFYFSEKKSYYIYNVLMYFFAIHLYIYGFAEYYKFYYLGYFSVTLHAFVISYLVRFFDKKKVTGSLETLIFISLLQLLVLEILYFNQTNYVFSFLVLMNLVYPLKYVWKFYKNIKKIRRLHV